MLKPSVSDLLTGTADALANTVLDELPPGPAHDQLQAAVALMRRVARTLPELTPYLQHDIRDMAVTLRTLWGAESLPTDDALAAALATADALPDASLPDLDALAAANLRLREAVADFVGTPAIGVASDQIVRALLERIEAREIALRLSPWGR